MYLILFCFTQCYFKLFTCVKDIVPNIFFRVRPELENRKQNTCDRNHSEHFHWPHYN